VNEKLFKKWSQLVIFLGIHAIFALFYLLEKMSKKKTASSSNKEQGINHT
jgi:hypothetical protein